MTAAVTIGVRPRISPLRYPGGKSALYMRLRHMIRNNGLTECTYVEPYAGGAGAGLGLLVTGQVKRVVINDLDPAIFAFWTLLVNDPDYLRRRIMEARLDAVEWAKQREIYLNRDNYDIDALGYATFYLNRTSRSGVLNAGPIGGHDQTGPYKIDARFNRDNLAERIRILALYADRIVVTSIDGKDVIKKYARRSNVLIYADPPYFDKARGLYMNAFAPADHESLAAVLNARAMRNWVLTYDNVPQVADLYRDRRRHEFELSYSAHRARKAKEIVVLSDSLLDVGAGWPLTDPPAMT
ncbi:DNA adenine methylase [Nonomuraea sp. NPDC049646]|uniref:DNA adenine methylase n=1 Tax=unclassified Nonomuraea TaxID=2593643 RepID=UPI0037ADB695